MVLREQLKANISEDLNNKSNFIIDELIAGREVRDIPKELLDLFRPAVQKYLTSYIKYDPKAEIAKLEIPILILQGTTDKQSFKIDANLLAEGNKAAQMLEIKGMNHLLKPAENNIEHTISRLMKSAKIEPKLIDSMVQFINKLDDKK